MRLPSSPCVALSVALSVAPLNVPPAPTYRGADLGLRPSPRLVPEPLRTFGTVPLRGVADLGPSAAVLSVRGLLLSDASAGVGSLRLDTPSADPPDDFLVALLAANEAERRLNDEGFMEDLAGLRFAQE